MEVERDELNRWARYANGVRGDTLRIRRLLAAGRVDEAQATLLRLHQTSAATLMALLGAGADRQPYLPETWGVPLELMDSPANRRLYRALREAWEAAVEVDRERGTHPYGGADGLAEKLARVEREVYGPTGTGGE